ncbi:conserved hypothetical protein [Syntrophobacter sp. SbD1]|nr:conserved hypothetical protein [Syntrophobacter sp. SbD1]
MSSPLRVEVTRIISERPALLSKRVDLNGDGRIKKSGGGNLSQGIAETKCLSVFELAEHIANLSAKNALCFGVCGYEKATIITQKALAERKVIDGSNKLPTIARTREHFHWPDGPGILFLDYDPEDGKTPLTRVELHEALYSVWPALKLHPHIWIPSASSCIYREDTGEELRGVMGQRVYIPVLKAGGIERCGKKLFERGWIAGFGRFDVSKSGALLERSLIDLAVFQPERLDYAGGAVCGPGLEQRRPKAEIFNSDAQFIDTRTLADLTPDETKELAGLKDQARQAKRTEVEIRQKEWVEERLTEALEKVPEGRRESETARLRDMYTRAVEQNRLFGDFELLSKKHGKVTVGELLDNRDKFHNGRFSDPLEPDYGDDPRIAWANLYTNGKPYLFSHAHGGEKFTLHRTLQTIRIEGGELPRMVEKVLDLIKIDGSLFDRGGELTRLAAGQIYQASQNWLLSHLTGLLRFEKFNKTEKTWKVVDCPLPVVQVISESQGEWSLPKLAGMITAPIMALDGRIIEADGYDKETGLYLDFPDSTNWPRVPETPTDKQVAEAAARLEYPFSEFLFVSKIARGGLLAAILTAVIRPVLPTAPAFYIGAPTPGSGKTLIALCLAALAEQYPEVIPKAENDEEMRKRLFSSARQGSKVLLFDNMSGTVESNSLCAFLTSPSVKDRVLGVSRMVSAPTNGLCLITGNNIIFAGDLNRRLIRIEIDPGCEKPHERQFDMKPLTYIRERRLEFIRDALTVLRGAMQHTVELKGDYGSFEDWNRLVRKAVVWVGTQGWLKVGDPLLSVAAGYKQDPEFQKLTALLMAWRDAFDKQGATVPEAIRTAEERDESSRQIVHPELFDILDEIAGERGKINSRRLGRWVERHVGRIVDGRWFAKGEKRQNYQIWIVQKVASREFGEFGEFALNPRVESSRKKLYGTNETNSHNSHNSRDDNDAITCWPCANFQANRDNPSFQGRCTGSPHDGDRLQFPRQSARRRPATISPPET